MKEVAPFTIYDLDLYSPCEYCGSLLWPSERPPQRTNTLCCESGAIDTEIPDTPLDRPSSQSLTNSQTAWHIRVEEEEARIIDGMIYETEDVEIDGQTKTVLTRRCKDFRQHLSGYNNAMAWASEGTGTIDHSVSHYSFRMQGEMRHYVGPLLAQSGVVPKFAQIYQVDSTQEQAETRQSHTTGLNHDTLRQLRTVLDSINPYVEGLKNCLERHQQEQSPQARIVLRQCDPARSERGTHNKPTNEDIATVITGMDNIEGTDPIHRDIVVQTTEGGLQRIPFWHSAYMPLRYPLLFPHGEPGWKENIGRNGYSTLPPEHLLAHRHRNRNPNTLQNHDSSRYRQYLEEEEAADGDGDNPPPAARGKGGSRRITTAQYYKKSIMVRLFPWIPPQK